jgi:hypothetical protein
MVLGTHFTLASDIIVRDHLTTSPSVPITLYRDVFENWCSRIVAPAGRLRLAADGVVRDSGLPDTIFASAFQHTVDEQPSYFGMASFLLPSTETLDAVAGYESQGA